MYTNVSSYKQLELAGVMSPMTQSQIIKIIGKYILLCNSSALSRIEFIFGMEILWDKASTTYHAAIVMQLPSQLR